MRTRGESSKRRQSPGEDDEEPPDNGRQGQGPGGTDDQGTAGTLAPIAAGAAIGTAAATIDGSSHRRSPSGSGEAEQTTGAAPGDTEPGGRSPGDPPSDAIGVPRGTVGSPDLDGPAGPRYVPARETPNSGVPSPDAPGAVAAPRDRMKPGPESGKDGPPPPGGSAIGPPSAGGAPNGAGRMLGLAAAAGLGTAATAGLLGSGHSKPADPGALPPAGGSGSHGHLPPGQSFPANSGGDQGLGPVAYAQRSPAAPAGSSAPGTGTPLSGAPTPGNTPQYAASGMPAQNPISQGSTGSASPPASEVHSTTPAHTGQTPLTIGPANAGQAPSYAGQVPVTGTSSLLYDSEGHPLGMVNGSEQLIPAPGSTWSGDPHSLPPVLYDSSGRPVAMVDNTGHVVPISATPGQPLTTTNTPGHQGVSQQHDPASSSASSSTVQPITVEVPGVEVPETGAQLAQRLRGETPAMRKQEIQTELSNSGINMPNGIKYWRDLPASFFDKDSYTYNDGKKITQLDALQAAAMVEMLYDSFSQFTVDIRNLSDAAAKVDSKVDEVTNPARPLTAAFDTAAKMWDGLASKFGDDPNITIARQNFVAIRSALLGGAYTDPTARTCGITPGAINAVVQSIQNQANSLRMIASKYVAIEEENLRQFSLHVDNSLDPRTPQDKKRFVNGKDTQANTK
jgi:hypothetical protein